MCCTTLEALEDKLPKHKHCKGKANANHDNFDRLLAIISRSLTMDTQNEDYIELISEEKDDVRDRFNQ